MKMYLISDSMDALTGMRFAGVEGIVVKDRETAASVLKKTAEDREIGILLITDKIAKLIEKEIREIKLRKSLPVVTVIPSRLGSKIEDNHITNYIKESIGLKL